MVAVRHMRVVRMMRVMRVVGMMRVVGVRRMRMMRMVGVVGVMRMVGVVRMMRVVRVVPVDRRRQVCVIPPAASSAELAPLRFRHAAVVQAEQIFLAQERAAEARNIAL